MFILPLHKPLSWASWPWMTTLLVLLNALVFFGPQAGDQVAIAQAQAYYMTSGLARVELPAYRRFLAERHRGDLLQALDKGSEQERASQLASAAFADTHFRQALAEGALIEPQARERWQPLRTEYDRRLGAIFTLRHLQLSTEWSPRRMLAAAFLHGDVMHLFGNMLFLIALGLLLEGAIGPWRLLGVYVVGAFGSGAASMWWHHDEAVAGLGASGAIAAMMGAFCAVWGRQPVRFFYWFGVIFDYVRAPAIWLFPLWLGWEVFSLLSDDDSRVAFEAHAGGLVTGALLGGLLVMMRQTRPAYMREDDAAVPTDDRWERAQIHLGRMENAEAESLLVALAAEQPARLDIALARCRVARNAGQRNALQRHAQVAISLPAADAAQAQAQWTLVRELRDTGWDVPTQALPPLLTSWVSLGLFKEAELLLEHSQPTAETREAIAQAWLKLALAHGARADHPQQRRLLERLLADYADQPQAAKARFLLENG
ncbi:MAG TPA: rhomboid family intramembrane serine protease [Stenotrophomonas sp.]|jgi:membrane associated rhomboid family serine protease